MSLPSHRRVEDTPNVPDKRPPAYDRDRDPRLVPDSNPFFSGHSLHQRSTGAPVEFAVLLAGRFEFNAYPAPDAACLRGTVTAGGREVPSQDWKPGEHIALYDAADLALVKHDHCKRAKASAYKAAKATNAIDMQPQPLARVNERSGPAQLDLAPGIYVVASSSKLPFAVYLKALPPAPEASSPQGCALGGSA